MPGDLAAPTGLGAVAEPRFAPDGRALAWVRAGTRADLVVAGAPGAPCVVTASHPAVRGARGGSFAWVDARHLVYAAVDGHLRVVPVAGGPVRTLTAIGRAAAPAVAPDGRVAFVDETDDECVIRVVAPDGSDAPGVVSRGADFAWDPAWAPDGALLAWHEWDVPSMPWDGSRIVVANPGEARRTVAGGEDEAVGQPRFAPTGRALAFVSDRDGWHNCTVATPDGTTTAVVGEPNEHAEPSRSPGQRSFAWSPDGSCLAVCRNEDGFGRLVVARLDGSPPVGIGRGWHHGIEWGRRGVVAVRSGARTPPVVTVTDPTTGARTEVERAPGSDGLARDQLVEPRPVTWSGDDGGVVHGLLYEPVRGPAGATPPLLVDLHGGPTGQATVTWSARPQHFVARGWAVLAPNPRGSTGYGRAYTQALAGCWGDLDVADTIAGIRASAERGWADPGRVAVVGGSAGGMLALLVAVRAPDLVGGVAVWYPVTDLLALAARTHRFERHSLATLVGPLPAGTACYRERSPVHHVAALRAPVLVFQGDADPVVAPEQTQRFVDALRAAGGEVTLHRYPGEGHGWQRPETAADVLRRTDEFLTRRVIGR